MTTLSDGYSDIPAGKIAAVVTHLEMLAIPPPRPAPPVSGLALRHLPRPEVDWYRALYARVGRDWLWFSRLRMPPAALAAIIHDPLVEVHALSRDGADEGLLELDFRDDGQCELAFFGLAPSLIGTGAGRLLMNAAISRAWARPIRRFWVHTCTLDHPAALGFYRRSGFVPYRQQVEVADDPRLTGALPMTAAPQVPILRG